MYNETEHRPAEPSISRSNPFRSRQAAPTFSYFIKPRLETISGEQLNNITAVFERYVHDGDNIPENIVIDVVKVTGLPDVVLAKLWDSVRSSTD
jgi:hypothetical protein